MLAVVVVAAGCAAAALLAWPAGAVGASASGLAAVSLPGFSGRIEHVSVTGPDGKTLPYVLRGDTVWPRARLAAGERVTVTVDVRRPGWIGWLVGDRVERTFTLQTPVAQIRSTMLRPKRGSAVTVRFAEPVARVRVGSAQASPGGRAERRSARDRRVGGRDRGHHDRRSSRAAVGEAVGARSRLVVRPGHRDEGRLGSCPRQPHLAASRR